MDIVFAALGGPELVGGVLALLLVAGAAAFAYHIGKNAGRAEEKRVAIKAGLEAARRIRERADKARKRPSSSSSETMARLRKRFGGE